MLSTDERARSVALLFDYMFLRLSSPRNDSNLDLIRSHVRVSFICRLFDLQPAQTLV